MVTDHSVLLVEAETADAEVLGRLLRERLPDLDLVVVESALAYTEVSQGRQFIAVIAAQELSWADGIDVLASFRSQHPRVPLILLAKELTAELVHRAVRARIDYQLEKNSSGMLALVGLIEESNYRPGTLGTAGNANWAEYTRDAPVAAATLTADGDIHEVNSAFQRIFGAQEWDGYNLHDLVPEDQPASVIREVLSGSGGPVRVSLRDGNGEARDLMLTAWRDPLSDQINLLLFDAPTAGGEYERDEERNARDELRQFVYAVSHDLQEPLQLANRYAKLLATEYKEQLDDTGRRSLRNLQQSTDRGQEMLDDLLEMSRLDRKEVRVERIDLNELVDEIFSLFQLTIEEIGAKVSREDLPKIYADRRQLARVFQNLIGNAIKFRSDKPLRILVTARDYGPAWCLVVRDNGIGIEPGQQKRVFEMFQRLHSKDGVPGSGMGLAICRRIVERHGGRIWLKSLPGKGSAFYFTLPRHAG